jgi:hypothetical protein
MGNISLPDVQKMFWIKRRLFNQRLFPRWWLMDDVAVLVGSALVRVKGAAAFSATGPVGLKYIAVHTAPAGRWRCACLQSGTMVGKETTAALFVCRLPDLAIGAAPARRQCADTLGRLADFIRSRYCRRQGSVPKNKNLLTRFILYDETRLFFK